MIKNLAELQKNSKNFYFAKRFSDALKLVGLEPSPKVIALEFNRHYKTGIAQPHTVRKWLVGAAKPRSEIMILLANWLNMDPKDLVRGPEQNLGATRRVSFDIEFNDQEVISKYLSLANKDKAIIRNIVIALSDDENFIPKT
jgi:hypothetical protein